MQEIRVDSPTASILTKSYWREAAKQRKDTKMLIIAALIVALRVILKQPIFKITIAQGLSITLDSYVNSLGSVIYGPVVAILVGITSDTLGVITTGRIGEYFLPFILTEVSSSVIFALFFWRKKITFSRALRAKFTVNLICNMIMTSLFKKWQLFIFYGVEKAEAYNLINGVRIAKNLILFPVEATLIIIILSAALPILVRLKLIQSDTCSIEKPSDKKMLLEMAFFVVLSVALVLFYIFFLQDFVSKLNINFL